MSSLCSNCTRDPLDCYQFEWGYQHARPYLPVQCANQQIIISHTTVGTSTQGEVSSVESIGSENRTSLELIGAIIGESDSRI